MTNNYLSHNFKNLIKVALDNKNKFNENKPFPHIIFDNFFNSKYLDLILENFPELEKNKNVLEFNSEKDKKKFATNKNFNYPEIINNFLNYLNSFEFLNFLQIITGIKEKLISDPYFSDGGLHETKKNGFLKIHADFNFHSDFHLDRRINVLIYLNKNWQESYGGELELWNKSMEKCEKKIFPIFNRLVIFNTNDFTFHGHPEPLNCPENMSRKSIALYYYSNGRPDQEINRKLPFHGTIYKNRKNFNENFLQKIPVYKKIFGKFYIKKKINSDKID